ncbi:hypothetical protein KY289_004949 [Solanum tuberosum]|nr:hypothetical protein KY289_004949 [Solanum tuberosum]
MGVSKLKSIGWCRPSGLGPNCGSRTTCWFNFRQNAETAGVYGSQSRDDFDRDDVEQGSLKLTGKVVVSVIRRSWFQVSCRNAR